MNRKEFEDALMATIVEYISDQVILRYAQACKKATVLFSGALIGYKDAVTSLNELKKDGWIAAINDCINCFNELA